MKSPLFYLLVTCLVPAEVPPNQDPNHREVRRVAVYVESVKGGCLYPNAYVDVVHTVASPQKSASRIILKNISVRGFEAHTVDAKKGPGVLVTLEVDAKKSTILLDARDGTLTLILLPIPGTVNSR